LALIQPPELAECAPHHQFVICNRPETDAPYLTPVPYRGKPNSPAYTYYTAEKLADIRGQTIETIADDPNRRNTHHIINF
jgi:Tat protein secretion system quality control protein TatD with DNase activity